MPSSESPLRWQRPEQFFNSWTNADADQPVEYSRDYDNVVMLRGVLSGGTSGTAAFYLPEGLRPRRDTVRLPVALGDGYGYIEIATTGAVTPYTPNYLARLSPKIAAYYPLYHLNMASQYGHLAGNGAYATAPAGWALWDCPSLTGYNREYRMSLSYYYAPNAATTNSNLYIRFSGTGSGYLFVPSGAKNVAADYGPQSPWATDATFDGYNGNIQYLEALGNWTTAVGNYFIRFCLVHVRYVPSSTAPYYLDGLNFHTAI